MRRIPRRLHLNTFVPRDSFFIDCVTCIRKRTERDEIDAYAVLRLATKLANRLYRDFVAWLGEELACAAFGSARARHASAQRLAAAKRRFRRLRRPFPLPRLFCGISSCQAVRPSGIIFVAPTPLEPKGTGTHFPSRDTSGGPPFPPARLLPSTNPGGGTRAMQFQCPHCNAVLQSDETSEGQEVECPSCSREFVIQTISDQMKESGKVHSDSFEMPKEKKHDEEEPYSSDDRKRSDLSRKATPLRLSFVESAISRAFHHGKNAFLRLPERLQGAVLASIVFLVGIAISSGDTSKGASKQRDSRPENRSASSIASPFEKQSSSVSQPQSLKSDEKQVTPRLNMAPSESTTSSVRDDPKSSSPQSRNQRTDEKQMPPRLDVTPLEFSQRSKYIFSCEEVDYQDVMRFPAHYAGKNVYISGKIWEVNDIRPQDNHRGSIRFWQKGKYWPDSDKEWIVLYDDERTSLPGGNLLKNDKVYICGTFEKVVESGRGKKSPRIIARLIELDYTN